MNEKPYRFRNVSPELREVARHLRRDMTRAEIVFWDAVRGQQIPGLRFRKQHPFGTHVIDFCCPSIKLAVEIDGGIHNVSDVAKHDEVREEWLRMNGFTILRFRNEDVLNNIESVLMQIRQIAESMMCGVVCPPPPAPPPVNGGRGEESEERKDSLTPSISSPLPPFTGGGAGGGGHTTPTGDGHTRRQV